MADSFDKEQELVGRMLECSKALDDALLARHNHLMSLYAEELPEYLANEPSRYFFSRLLGFSFANEAEQSFQDLRGALLRAIDHSVAELQVQHEGFDYKAFFEGYLDDVFSQVEQQDGWDDLRAQMIALYPEQLCIAADYFAGLRKSRLVSWKNPNRPSNEQLKLQEQEDSARDFKDALEQLRITLKDLGRRIEKGSFAEVEAKRLAQDLEEFDVARWNFAQLAIEYIKGQVYEAILTEVNRVDAQDADDQKDETPE